jgi:hypothetical protein
VAEYQITYWRELPSLVVARDGADSRGDHGDQGDQGDHGDQGGQGGQATEASQAVAKTPLPQRFQEAIDEAAMRLGETASDAYLAGWRRSEWAVLDGSIADVAEQVAADLERQWPTEAVEAFLNGLDRTSEGTP